MKDDAGVEVEAEVEAKQTTHVYNFVVIIIINQYDVNIKLFYSIPTLGSKTCSGL